MNMSFVKESVNTTPIVDTVFTIVSKAKEAKKLVGEENVVDATIGSLYDEQGNLVALDTVFTSLKQQENAKLASYAESFRGNPSFREDVYQWVLQGQSQFHHAVIATPGGTGAVSMTISSCLEQGQSLIIPEIAWGSYALMAQMQNLDIEKYALFEEDHFNMKSFQSVVRSVMSKQSRVVIIINDPCHNPTGYSLSEVEWDQIITFLNECAKTHDIVLLNDIAYIDFSYQGQNAKSYMRKFNELNENVMVVIAFSLSKSMTSYGLRCGASIILGKDEQAVEAVKNVFEKEARATWSNTNNGAMLMFSDIMEHHLLEYEAEKQTYVDLLKQRSEIFVQEAKEVGLRHYPYKEGFFVTLCMDNETRDRYHEALMKHHIYTVKVNLGIRVAVCSLSIEKIQGLAKRMKEIFDQEVHQD